MKQKRPSFEDLKKQAMLDEDFVNEYKSLNLEFSIMEQLIVARKRARISQAEMAAKLHTQQPAIARYENGGFESSSIRKLQEYAGILGYDLELNLVPKRFHD